MGLLIKVLKQEIENINMDLVNVEICDNFLKNISGKNIKIV